jgi:hypothetical protein
VGASDEDKGHKLRVNNVIVKLYTTRPRGLIVPPPSRVELSCTMASDQMAATPAPAQKNTVHWAPSPVQSPLSDTSSTSTTSIYSTSTLHYVNSQLISHGFVLPPGLSLDSLSSAEADGVTKCLLAMLSQRVVRGRPNHYFVASLSLTTANWRVSLGRHDARRRANDKAAHALVRPRTSDFDARLCERDRRDCRAGNGCSACQTDVSLMFASSPPRGHVPMCF